MIITIDTMAGTAYAETEYNGLTVTATIDITYNMTAMEIYSRLTDDLSENVLNAISPYM